MFDLLIHNARIITLDAAGTLENGYLLIKAGKIAALVEGASADGILAKEKIDAMEMICMPGLVDCHTHLMEYAASEIHQVRGSAQKMAGTANLLSALRSGIVALGEHHLGHPVLIQQTEEYMGITKSLPVDVKLATGCCFIGTDPLTLVSSTVPGQVIDKENLTDDIIREMAERSEFPGENLFLNATVANLPLSLAPNAGAITFTAGELANIVEIFHCCGKKIGAHLEGNKAAEMFITAGGDVIHHGHGVKPEVGELMAQRDIPLVVTPHGGTSAKPTSPEEVYQFYKRGVKLVIASDSYLPPHPEASWIDVPQRALLGPEDFMRICHPVFKYLLDQGVSQEEVLKMVTVNGREILGDCEAGSLKPGNKADLIICTQVPGIETVDPSDIKYVVKNGEVVISKL